MCAFVTCLAGACQQSCTRQASAVHCRPLTEACAPTGEISTTAHPGHSLARVMASCVRSEKAAAEPSGARSLPVAAGHHQGHAGVKAAQPRTRGQAFHIGYLQLTLSHLGTLGQGAGCTARTTSTAWTTQCVPCAAGQTHLEG